MGCGGVFNMAWCAVDPGCRGLYRLLLHLLLTQCTYSIHSNAALSSRVLYNGYTGSRVY